ncbi:uncharacterized protein LOC114278595 [Camellia sinensis]|uniref:uncharacterized protein LOC114278595 n=1 Tax=Camellia sinensis TaxID=4442 RepID=UPI001035F9C9|nr:uncharacterized protein LOC114278595 [Camellia sinensis]
MGLQGLMLASEIKSRKRLSVGESNDDNQLKNFDIKSSSSPDIFSEINTYSDAERSEHNCMFVARLETRTGCKAFIRLIVEDGIWRVTAFNPEHNHKLALQSERHLLRSACHISKLKAGVIDSIVNAGLRSLELDEDFRCKQGAPQKIVKKSGSLGHAAQVYTCKIFKLFENEFLNSLAMVEKQVDCQDTIDVFELKEENSERVHIVHFDHLTNNISCSCKKFESLGVLCCHALRVFSIKNLTTIPNQYISKRWKKDAKKGIMAYEQGANSIANGKEVEIIWRNSMIRIAIYKSQGNDSLKNICQKILTELDEKIEREFARLKLGTDDMDFANIPFTTMLQNVNVVNQFSEKNDSHTEKLQK